MNSKKYNPIAIEKKWQEVWAKEKTYQPDVKHAKKPFYNLMMFPYPSAEGLHVGNMYAFTGADVYGRFKRMQGHDVFEPIGLDGFGIHAENYALKIGEHPMRYSKVTEANFYRQLHAIGNGFAWDNTVETYKPEYYKWTQWLFVQLFKAGLAYRKKQEVNFCPSCKTVLADEQVIDGKCERCGSIVEKRKLEQWFFKITAYAEQLLENIEGLHWSEKVKIAQRQWIGKSVGARIKFEIYPQTGSLDVFTTRPDTLYGATFLVISPEHPIVNSLLSFEFPVQSANVEAVKNYVMEAQRKTEPQRIEAKEKTGVFSGLQAIHPLTKEKLPIWIADYVLMTYGTGAIMAVPAHDERDFAFAKKYDLPIKAVIQADNKELPYRGFGKLINSGNWHNWQMPQEIDKIFLSLEDKQIGKKQVQYHLRDWLISRQRYWGPPIPMIFCEECAAQGRSWFTKHHKAEGSNWNSAGWYPEENLPVALPYIEDFKPIGTGESPLSKDPNFSKVTCPGCGKHARRETDVSDTFLDSAWYFFRYPSTDIENRIYDIDITKKWLPVNMYIGGAEHSVLHLLYARFMTMFLHDQGLADFAEPFTRFYALGLIIKDGAKMSKSKGNIVNPDVYISKYGADALRAYLQFLGPFNQGGDFRDTGIEGMHRFLKRVWTLITTRKIISKEATVSAKSVIHRTIKEVTEDMEHLRYNTALAKLMTYYNYFSDKEELELEVVETFLKLFAPFAPHITEELWQEYIHAPTAGFDNAQLETFHSIHTSSWPSFDPKFLVIDEVPVVVQVNGKVRATFILSSEQAQKQQAVERIALHSEKIQKFLPGNPKKIIFVPGKLINIVV